MIVGVLVAIIAVAAVLEAHHLEKDILNDGVIRAWQFDGRHDETPSVYMPSSDS